MGCGGRVASPLVHDKGYYHSCLGRSRKGTFRPYQTPEPQPRGAVTRRALRYRRSSQAERMHYRDQAERMRYRDRNIDDCRQRDDDGQPENPLRKTF